MTDVEDGELTDPEDAAAGEADWYLIFAPHHVVARFAHYVRSFASATLTGSFAFARSPFARCTSLTYSLRSLNREVFYYLLQSILL